MTASLIHLNIPGMGSPGRRLGTPAQFRREFAARIRASREKVGLSQVEMAAELSDRSGRLIAADSYRKWEALTDKQNSLLPHDLILAFCDIAEIHPFDLLRSDSTHERLKSPKKKVA